MRRYNGCSPNLLGSNKLRSILSVNGRRCGGRGECGEKWKPAVYPAASLRWLCSHCSQDRGADIPACHATTVVTSNQNEHHPMTDKSESPERKIELLEAELRHARRMAALGDLVSTTTHEFNN